MNATIDVIANAVAPLKEKALQRAMHVARETIREAHCNFVANNWDLNKCAPRPNVDAGRRAFKEAMAKREFYSCISSPVPVIGYRSQTDPYFVKQNELAEATFITRQAENAVASYNAFVVKLCEKVGEVVEATLDVSVDVWSDSVLTVKKANGSVYRWKTQMIVNCSVLGKVFNQWPTRQVK
jgi:hypothetical protein